MTDKKFQLAVHESMFWLLARLTENSLTARQRRAFRERHLFTSQFEIGCEFSALDANLRDVAALPPA
jgi:hypothetical protein